MPRCMCNGMNDSCHYCGGTGFLGGLRPSSPKQKGLIRPPKYSISPKTKPLPTIPSPPLRTTTRECKQCGAPVYVELWLTHRQAHLRREQRALEAAEAKAQAMAAKHAAERREAAKAEAKRLAAKRAAERREAAKAAAKLAARRAAEKREAAQVANAEARRKVALQQLESAANRGSLFAAMKLAVACEDGHGRQPDYVEAFKWRSISLMLCSARKKSGLAVGRDHLATRLTSVQLAEAQERVAAWLVRRR